METIIRGSVRDTRPESLGTRRLVITLDGPAGAGKSTVARQLASRLGYLYLDTGALYRAIAWKVQEQGIAPEDEERVGVLLRSTRVSMAYDPVRPKVFVDGQDVTDRIRTPEISRLASQVSALPAVREWLLPVQREIGAGGGIVAEGRDLGTRVFPGADAKFFLDADLATRAARRHKDLTATASAPTLDQTSRELAMRDERDRSRELAPLAAAADAVHIDTSSLGIDAVVAKLMDVIATKL